MTPEQWERYGDRCPKGFIKLAIMDIGPHSIVWLASNKFTNEKLALRQIPSIESRPLAKNEMTFYSAVFNHTGMFDTVPPSNPKLANMEGIKHIVRLHERIEDSRDLWFSYKMGRKPLSEWLFSIKFQISNDEQICSVQHQKFYKLLSQSKYDISLIIKQCCEFLKVLQKVRIVHGNLRPGNILCKYNGFETALEEIQITGFSHCQVFEEMNNLTTEHLEYMPPEILRFMLSASNDYSKLILQ
jgi:serine/threonine protein kinase